MSAVPVTFQNAARKAAFQFTDFRVVEVISDMQGRFGTVEEVLVASHGIIPLEDRRIIRKVLYSSDSIAESSDLVAALAEGDIISTTYRPYFINSVGYVLTTIANAHFNHAVKIISGPDTENTG